MHREGGEPRFVLNESDCHRGSRFVRDLMRSMPRDRVLSEWESQFVAMLQAGAEDYVAAKVTGSMSATQGRTSVDLHVGHDGPAGELVGGMVRYVTTAEVAKLLDVSERHANRLRRERRWACRKQSGRWLIDVDDVQDYLDALQEDAA